MKISQLPEPYKKLAELRSVHKSAFLNTAFTWTTTPEGDDFWGYVNRGEYPLIPYKSLVEIGLVEKPERWEVEVGEISGDYVVDYVIRRGPTAIGNLNDCLSKDIAEAIAKALNELEEQ